MAVDAQALFQQQYSNRHLGSAAKQLNISPYDVGNSEQVGDYERAFQASLTNPLYLQVAEKLGLKGYNSVNDYAQVLNALTGGLAIGASANNGSGGGGLPAPNNGSYGNIVSNINAQAEQGAQQAQDYNNRQATSSAGTPVSATDQTTAAITAQAAAQAKLLQDLMIQQGNAYEQQMALQQQQITAANAAYAEQQRQADALSRAYIPAPAASAASPVFGATSSSGKSASSLSSLAIGGYKMGGSSLNGLQIA